ncbi:MAG: hypothetical protein ACR2N6_06995 [Miltoncostaeaceae bacterium]
MAVARAPWSRGRYRFRRMSGDLPHLWAVTSGWDGPFQKEEVIVVAHDLQQAVAHAEEAFAEVAQPVCRAKVRARDLGRAAAGLVVGPRVSGESFGAGGVPIERRCDDPAEP